VEESPTQVYDQADEEADAEEDCEDDAAFARHVELYCSTPSKLRTIVAGAWTDRKFAQNDKRIDTQVPQRDDLASLFNRRGRESYFVNESMYPTSHHYSLKENKSHIFRYISDRKRRIRHYADEYDLSGSASMQAAGIRVPSPSRHCHLWHHWCLRVLGCIPLQRDAEGTHGVRHGAIPRMYGCCGGHGGLCMVLVDEQGRGTRCEGWKLKQYTYCSENRISELKWQRF
jgi:hypothetical protein